MQQLSVPASPRVYSTQYRTLLGVDYQKDVTDVDRRRSPDMVNMISDLGGNPIKRDGYRIAGDKFETIVQTSVGRIFGVWVRNSFVVITELVFREGGLRELTTSQYLINIPTTDNSLVGKFEHKLSCAFAKDENVYVISSAGVIKFNTDSNTFSAVHLRTATEIDSEPEIDDSVLPNIISLNPDGSGGVVQYGKNLFSPYVRYEYIANGEDRVFKLPNYDRVCANMRVEVMNDNGVWELKEYGHDKDYMFERVYDQDGADEYGNRGSFRTVKPSIQFINAPAKPTIAGQDNVRIVFTPFYDTAVMDNGVIKRWGVYNKEARKLLESDVFTWFNNRLFIAKGNHTYYSAANNPFHIADNSYFDVDSEILCYTTTNSHLAVLTKDTGKNTVYLADQLSSTTTKALMGDDYDTFFSVKPSNAGVGAISKHCIDVMNDEPLFLANTGLYAIQTNFLSDKYVVNRSTRINRRLCKEPNLENAVGKSFNGYFYLAINGHMYVFDSRHKESDKAGNKPYEAYFFDNIPNIKAMYVFDNKMYFADDEHTYTWNDDLREFERYYDGSNYNFSAQAWEGGTPVYCRWCSVHDDDGAPQKLKSLQKRGSMVTVVPHAHSTFHITLMKDGDGKYYLGSFRADRLMFESIDFSKFTFSTNAVSTDVFTKKKIKKYKRLQIIIESKDPEPLGITNVVKSYTVGTLAKK